MKNRGRDGKSNKTFPLTPALSRGERENMRTLRQHLGNVSFDPTHRSSAPSSRDHHLHDRTPWRVWPFLGSRVILPLPKREGGVRGKGLPCRLRPYFQPLAPVSILPKIARNQYLMRNKARRTSLSSRGTGEVTNRTCRQRPARYYRGQRREREAAARCEETTSRGDQDPGD
jgi:hypothetical protein